MAEIALERFGIETDQPIRMRVPFDGMIWFGRVGFEVMQQRMLRVLMGAAPLVPASVQSDPPIRTGIDLHLRTFSDRLLECTFAVLLC